MIKILIAYPSMGIGGSTTSLLGLLQSLDYAKVQIDLQLYENQGAPPFSIFPKKFICYHKHVLFRKKSNGLEKYSDFAYPQYWCAGIQAVLAQKKYPGTLAAAQITAQARAKASRRNTKQYDVAIGFLEMWSDAYVATKIQADKKIAWIHIDYINAGMVPKYDDGILSCFDKIVLVSKECLNSFISSFPRYSKKAIYIENILHQIVVKQRSNEFKERLLCSSDGIQFGTVCRIEFRHKGLDRALRAFKKMREEGYNFDWHIIGEGSDRQKLENMIHDMDLDRNVHLYGSRINPLPLVETI